MKKFSPIDFNDQLSVSGLQLVLYTQDVERLSGITIARGFKITPHEFGTRPNLDSGMSLPPGFETFIGMRLVRFRWVNKHLHESCEIRQLYEIQKSSLVDHFVSVIVSLFKHEFLDRGNWSDMLFLVKTNVGLRECKVLFASKLSTCLQPTTGGIFR